MAGRRRIADGVAARVGLRSEDLMGGGSPSRYVLLILLFFFLLCRQRAGGDHQSAGGRCRWIGGGPALVGEPPGPDPPPASRARCAAHWVDGDPTRPGPSRRRAGAPDWLGSWIGSIPGQPPSGHWWGSTKRARTHTRAARRRG